MTEACDGKRNLRRRLGVLDGAAVVISNVVGTGIFLTPPLIASRMSSATSFLGLWILGGGLALIGALSYAELGAMRPRAGGEYVYIREAFGPLAGFLSGWTSLVAGFSGAVAAAAVGFAIYLDRFIPGVGSTETFLEVSLGMGEAGLRLTPRALTALLLVGFFSLVHARGLGPGRMAQQILAWLNVTTILGLVVLGFLTEPAVPVETVGSAAIGTAGGPVGDRSLGSALVALVLVMFTYSGWNAGAYLTEEFRDPGTRLPRALLLGTVVVIALYLALNLLYVDTLGLMGLAATEAAGDQLAHLLWGERGAFLITPLILLALASSVSAMVFTGPRVYYAMARDGCLPKAFARTGEARVPAFSIGAQAAWSALLILTGGFEALLTYTGFAVVLFAALGVGSLFVLRRTKPRADRPFRLWGHPVLPGLFLLASAGMVIQSLLRAPAPSLLGILVIFLGIPVFMWLRRRDGGEGRRPSKDSHQE
ncbi:MAG: amino acid permease [Longimicrobiales bacterium]